MKSESKHKSSQEEDTPLLAVIRLRGSISVSVGVKDTLSMLRLFRVNHCMLVPGNPDFTGMLKRAKEYITWGEINPETLEKLIFKRGRVSGNKKLNKKDAKKLAEKILKSKSIKRDQASLNPVFRLSPPSKGYKSVKRHFPKGDLGYRGERINSLLKRMI